MDTESELNAHSVDSSFELHSLRFVVYVDNIAAFEKNASQVDRMMRKIKKNKRKSSNDIKPWGNSPTA